MSNEDAVEDSEPREWFLITHGNTSYPIASGDRDVPYGNVNYVATPSAILDIPVATTDEQTQQTTFRIIATHALVQRYLALGSPPNSILLVARRGQADGSDVQQLFAGYIMSLGFDGNLAVFALVSRAGLAMRKKLPTILVDTMCQHVLYDANCKADQPSNTISTTIASIDGRNLLVASMSGKPDQWARYGVIKHVASGEQQTIWDQVGTAITMAAAVVEMHAGDAIEISRGCAHDTTACRDDFANILNYGGLPNRPTKNPFVPTGMGVIEQE